MSLIARLISRANGEVPEDDAAPQRRMARLSPKDRGMRSGIGLARQASAGAEPDEMAPMPMREQSDEAELATPMRAETEDEAAEASRAEVEEDAAPTPMPHANRTPSARREEEEEAQASRMDEAEETAQARREEEEEAAQPRRAEEDEAPPVQARRDAMDEPDAPAAKRKAEPEEEEEELQLRRAESALEEPEAAAQRQSATDPLLPAEPLDELRHDQAGGQARAHRNIGDGLAPPMAADMGTPAGLPQAPIIAPPAAPPVAVDHPAPAASRPKVQIDQIDVIVTGDAAAAAQSTRATGGSARALLTNRYLRRI